jgi:hypothetical protein
MRWKTFSHGQENTRFPSELYRYSINISRWSTQGTAASSFRASLRPRLCRTTSTFLDVDPQFGIHHVVKATGRRMVEGPAFHGWNPSAQTSLFGWGWAKIGLPSPNAPAIVHPQNNPENSNRSHCRTHQPAKYFAACPCRNGSREVGSDPFIFEEVTVGVERRPDAHCHREHASQDGSPLQTETIEQPV